MKDRYLEVTFRKGKPLAAYLYLPRQTDARSVRTESVGDGLLVDYAANGHPIGLEITAPTQVTLDQVNAVLEGFELPPMTLSEWSPLQAA